MLDALHVGRKFLLQPSHEGWNFQKVLLEDLKKQWRLPDQGIWEIRSPPRHFTHSKLMAWVAFDRGVRAVENFGLDGLAERRMAERDGIRAEHLSKGWSQEKPALAQHYAGSEVDSSLFQLTLIRFLP